MSVDGGVARSVADVALLLSVIAGPDPRSPVAIDEPGRVFRRALARDFKGTRIAWSRNLAVTRWSRSSTTSATARGMCSPIWAAASKTVSRISAAPTIFPDASRVVVHAGLGLTGRDGRRFIGLRPRSVSFGEAEIEHLDDAVRADLCGCLGRRRCRAS